MADELKRLREEVARGNGNKATVEFRCFLGSIMPESFWLFFSDLADLFRIPCVKIDQRLDQAREAVLDFFIGDFCNHCRDTDSL